MEELYGKYVDELLARKGVIATSEQRSALLAHIDQAVDKALLEALPTEQLRKLNESSKANSVDDDIVEHLLVEAGVDPANVIQNVLNNYKNSFLQEGK